MLRDLNFSCYLQTFISGRFFIFIFKISPTINEYNNRKISLIIVDKLIICLLAMQHCMHFFSPLVDYTNMFHLIDNVFPWCSVKWNPDWLRRAYLWKKFALCHFWINQSRSHNCYSNIRTKFNSQCLKKR